MHNMAMRLICVAVALLGCVTVAHFQAISVKLLEEDYEEHEEAGSLNLTVKLLGQNMADNSISLRVDAFTRQQFVAQGISCNNAPNFENELADEGEDADLVANSTTCSGVPSAEPGTKIICSFEMAQDGILERDEYLVFMMTIVDNGGYTINTGRNCAIGRISAHASLEILNAIGFPLVITNSAELMEVTEGATIMFNVEKRFQTELNITVKFEISSNVPPDLLSDSTQSNDYMISIVTIPPTASSISVPMVIVDDAFVERTEYLNITFLSRVAGLDITGGLPIDNNRFEVAIRDNDVLRVGLDTTQDVITVKEGDSLVICTEIKEPNSVNILRGTALDMSVNDGSAMRGTDFTTTDGGSSTINLEEGSHCVTIFTRNNALAEGDKMLQVQLIDTVPMGLSDPADVERWRQLNTIEPNTVTVVIQDDEGPPNQPNVTVTVTGTVPNTGGKLTVTWETENEDGAHPVVCHFGNITERFNQMETETSFNFCTTGSPNSQQFNVTDFDPSKLYIVVVCAKNQIGHNCSDPVTIPPVPTVSIEALLPPGTIAVIVIVVLIAVMCCGLLLVLLFVFVCCDVAWWRSYNPEKRERKYGNKNPPVHCHDPLSDETEMNVYYS